MKKELTAGDLVQELVNEDTCFSPECWWVSALIRCRNCPYIDNHGRIRDLRVGKLPRPRE